MATLERAIKIAVDAHAGQTDKAGRPYILHPLRVMFAVDSDPERIVGILHDVCEDCPGWNFERLGMEGFSHEVIAALESVTKRRGEFYDDFVKRAAADPIGRRVKLADLLDNSDLSRISEPTEHDHARMARYQKAISYLRGNG
jgi:(p)ppGpp synthase/HD superfamily hydrolase